MPSLKDIKMQINSVGSTKKITSAMKMVAASKLRRSQEKAEAARPYSSRLEEMLLSLVSSPASGEGVIQLLTGTGNDENYIIVPVSADRGLCGGFNSSINRETVKYLNRSYKNNTLSKELAGPIGIVKMADQLMLDKLKGVLFLFVMIFKLQMDIIG